MARRAPPARRPQRDPDRRAASRYHAEWLARPGNRERQKAASRRWRQKPTVREAIAARKRQAYAAGKAGRPPRTGRCAICGGGFRLNRVGRPRIYCDGCVSEFHRSDRRCPRCKRTMDHWRRRMTCRHCGALWMRGRPPA